MAEEQEAMLKINDQEYKISDLSDNAKAQLQSLRFADVEIQRLNMQVALAKTARNAYQSALVDELPKVNAH